MSAPMREDLLTSAVTFLTDRKTADSPLTQRLQFLEAKGLSEVEILEALRRAGLSAGGASSPTTATATTSVETIPAQAPQQPAAAAYAPPRPAYYPGQLLQSAGPPPVAPRDWKDFFVMATATAGVSYGLYVLAKRYVLPLITPPTPAVLEADKDAITAEFDRTAQLLQQLQADTEALKDAEHQRMQALDSAVEDLHRVLQDAKEQLQSRDTEMRSLQAEIETVRSELPKYFERSAESHKKDLFDIQTEIKSLKQILSNRLRSSTVPTAPTASGPIPSSAPVNATTSIDTSNALPVRISQRAIPPSRASIPAWQLAAVSKQAAAPAPLSASMSADITTSLPATDKAGDPVPNSSPEPAATP
ncbi:peroxisomal membrane anchor protein conserved region-domain-containing protein [Limtongia smithiae]|uniref:peroxisomal membrane anchor protein conserved region-domain-containing protein n=1 Tax=Limtongia smithiae TaxID=1125753 RepID=UPI0034CE26DD